MLKGCRKQMIVLRGTGSEIFDEAYFILKKNDDDRKYRGQERSAMLLEANRILEENRLDDIYRPHTYYALRYSLFFLAGLIMGVGSVLLALAMS